MKKKKLTIGIFLDFRKAFDSIKHEILLNKLHVYGIRGAALELMNSYLDSRLQYTSLQDYSSDKSSIKYGVPQGSILGPLLFIAYINDIVNIPLTDEMIMYADDTNVFFSGADLQELEVTANSWLKELHQWLYVNQLNLNAKKTKFTVFCSKNKEISYDVKLLYCGSQLEHVTSHSFLGVIFHKNLSWSEHINKVRTKVARSVGLLRRIRCYLPVKFVRQLYFSLVHSHLSYGLLVWGNGNKTDIEKLAVLQRRAVRLLNSSNQYIGSSKLMMRYNILDIRNSYRSKICIRLFKEVSSNFETFSNRYLSRDTGYSLRRTSIVMKKARTNYGMQTIEYETMSLCNMYPNVVKIARSCKTIHEFKQSIMNMFLASELDVLCKC